VTGKGSTILVVGPTTQEFAHVVNCLSDWDCLLCPVDEDSTTISPPTPTPTPNVILVCARKEPERTVSICGQLWNRYGIADLPILLAVNKYAIAQGHEIRRLGKSDFIITPFTERFLREKVAAILGSEEVS